MIMRKILTILLILGITLMLSTVYGCVYTITTKHFKICLKYCDESEYVCSVIIKNTAKLLESVYNFYVKHGLKMVRSCSDKYYVILGEAGEVFFGELNNKLCVKTIFVEDDPFIIAHELAHLINNYYNPNIPSWIDESLANALAYYYLNISWNKIGFMMHNMCEDIKAGYWIPGVPYDYWPFFYYLILKYGPLLVEEKCTNITWLRQNWLPFIEHVILFKSVANCLADYSYIIYYKDTKMTRQIIVSPYFSPTIITIRSIMPIAVRLRVNCPKSIIIFPNTTLLAAPGIVATYLLTTYSKRYMTCKLVIETTQIKYTTHIELNGKIYTLREACDNHLINIHICNTTIRTKHKENIIKINTKMYRKIKEIQEIVLEILKIIMILI